VPCPSYGVLCLLSGDDHFAAPRGAARISRLCERTCNADAFTPLPSAALRAVTNLPAWWANAFCGRNGVGRYAYSMADLLVCPLPSWRRGCLSFACKLVPQTVWRAVFLTRERVLVFPLLCAGVAWLSNAGCAATERYHGIHFFSVGLPPVLHNASAFSFLQIWNFDGSGFTAPPMRVAAVASLRLLARALYSTATNR